MSSPRSGSRVTFALLAALAAAVALVLWLAFREPPPEPPPERPAPLPVRPAPVPAKPPARVQALTPATPVARPQDEPRPEDEDEPAAVVLEAEVRGADGQPARGAHVVLVDPFAHHAGTWRPAEIERQRTGDDGVARFRAPERVVRLYAWHGSDAGATEKFRVTRSTTRVSIALTASIAVRGRVVDTLDRGIPDADVRLVASPWFDDPFGLVLDARSSADGSFELPSIPGTAFDVAPNGVAIEARARSWPLASVRVTADTLRAGEVVVRLERGGTLRGRVTAASGSPLAGCAVRLLDGRAGVTSGDDGRFELPLPPGGGKVLFLRQASARERRDPAKPPQRGAPKVLGPFAGASDVDVGDVVLSEGQPVLGQVVDLDDRPVRDADVELHLAGIVVASTRTDDQGRFRLDDVSEEPQVLRAVEPLGDGAWTGRREARVADVRGGSPDVRVVLTGALTVFVRFLAESDRTPVVVPEVTLRAVATGDTPREFGWSWAGTGLDSVRFPVPHAGTFDVSVELPGYERATASVAVLPDREVRIDVLFRKLP